MLACNLILENLMLIFHKSYGDWIVLNLLLIEKMLSKTVKEYVLTYWILCMPFWLNTYYSSLLRSQLGLQ